MAFNKAIHLGTSWGAPAYAGPGDVVSGAYLWVSPARAYSAAFAATLGPVMDLVDQAGANPVTINILATGYVDTAAIAAWVTANSVSTIKVAKLYDQSGNARHVSNATLATMPTLVLNAINSTLPVIDNPTGANFFLATSGTHSVPLPYSYSAVWKTFASNSAGGLAGGAANGSTSSSFGVDATPAFGFRLNGVNTFKQTYTNPHTAFHAGQAVAVSGASNSTLNIDGTESTGTYAAVISAEAIRVMREGSGGASFPGKIAEVGIWAAAFSGPQRTAMNANQHGTTGYNF